MSRCTIPVAALAALCSVAGPAFAPAWAADAPAAASARPDERSSTRQALLAAAVAELRRAFPAPAWRLEIVPVDDDAVPTVAIGDGPVEWVARRLADGVTPSPRQTVWVDIRQNGVPRRSVAVVVAARAWVQGWVARADLAPGLRPGAGWVERAEVDAAQAGAPLWQGELDGHVLRSPVRAGQPLLQRQVAAAPAVARGERVALLLRERALEIRASAHALQDGESGQTIRVRVGEGAALTARVLGPGVTEFLR